MGQRHPREGAKALREGLERQLGRPLSRRDFLRASAGAAVTVPTLSAILAACSNPREKVAAASSVATPDNPVKLPIVGSPIADNLPVEKNATLQIYNWDLYIWKYVVDQFCKENDCDYEIATFNNMEDGVAKLTTGQLQVDIFFPTYDVLGKLVRGGFLQPLNKTYIPNLADNAWSMFQSPFYDVDAQYSIPYTVYTTGISYRRDHIPDDTIYGMDNPYSILWDPQYTGKVGIYDSYRDAIGMVLLKNGIDNVNTENQTDIDVAKADLLKMITDVNIRYSINGSYAKLPKGEYYAHQSWSGDIVAGWSYTPHADEADYETLGYWYPDDRIGVVDNDLIAIPSSAPHPVLAHKFLDFMLDFQHSMDNFSWNGYQPPQKQAQVSKLTTTEGLYSKLAGWAAPAMYVSPLMPNAVVRESDLKDATSNYRIHELTVAGDQIWQDAWEAFKSGA